MPGTESNKARIAKRVIEVLEFFDDDHPQATVMDIVRRFDRPQSSTSELLSSLVDLGLLYKDPASRSYSPTPRAAMLSNAAQPSVVRGGRLVALIDRLAAQTGLGIGLFGMVGLKAQIYSWRGGKRAPQTADRRGLRGGQQDTLVASSVGWLLLSTVERQRREGIIRRLNAEATLEQKFVFADMAARVERCRELGWTTGVAGFDSICDATAILIPGMPAHQPLAIGFVYEPSAQVDPDALLRSLTEAVERYIRDPDTAPSVVQPLFATGRQA